MPRAWEDATDAELLAACHAQEEPFAVFYRRHERLVAGLSRRRPGCLGSHSYACSRSVKISLAYTRGIEGNIAVTALGNVTVHIPRGDHARPLPRSVKQRLREAEPLGKRR